VQKSRFFLGFLQKKKESPFIKYPMQEQIKSTLINKNNLTLDIDDPRDENYPDIDKEHYILRQLDDYPTHENENEKNLLQPRYDYFYKDDINIIREMKVLKLMNQIL
jgi:hypothetical protein